MKTTFDYAKEYIDQGIYVFPLYKVIGGKCNCTDSECKHPGKHPKIGNWRNTASNKLEDIEIWFKNNEGSNIAILTGKKSNI